MSKERPRIRLPTREQLEPTLREVCLVAGLVMLARGLWLIYPPAMWAICGLILIWCGLPLGRKGG